MKTLQDEVVKRGFTVAHIKTDSIKIPNATPGIISFCMDFAKQYGYTFEHEATYDKMCLVNDAVYIAHGSSSSASHAGEWTATGTQFQVPYVFKTLFSKEALRFSDMCVTQSTKDALYLDFNEGLPDVKDLEKELAQLNKARRKPEDKMRYIKRYCHGDPSVGYEWFDEREKELRDDISKGHKYVFIGRVGQFTPVKDGFGGGLLYRGRDGKYTFATGASGYRWKESELVRRLEKTDEIDTSYFDALVNKAKKAIEVYGDFEAFVNEEEYDIPF